MIDGIPKDKNFPLKEVLYRIVSIHLISQKVANVLFPISYFQRQKKIKSPFIIYLIKNKTINN